MYYFISVFQEIYLVYRADQSCHFPRESTLTPLKRKFVSDTVDIAAPLLRVLYIFYIHRTQLQSGKTTEFLYFDDITQIHRILPILYR